LSIQETPNNTRLTIHQAEHDSMPNDNINERSGGGLHEVPNDDLEEGKAKQRSNKLIKNESYTTKLSGADFFKWSKEQRKNQERETRAQHKAQSKDQSKDQNKDQSKDQNKDQREDSGSGIDSKGETRVGYTVYSDFVKKNYFRARKEMGDKASHKEVMCNIAERWRTSDERTINLNSKSAGKLLKCKQSETSETMAKRRRTAHANTT